MLLVVLAPVARAQAPDPAPEAEAARALQTSRELAARQQAIEELQSLGGIYEPALMEAYGDLGRFYLELEDYANAVRLYSDALQVARINTGLYSEPQFDIIAALIDGNGKLQDWEEVDDLQELSFHLASRLYGIDDGRYLAAAEHYGNWNLRVVRENLLGLSSWTLINRARDLSDFYENIIIRTEQQTAFSAESLTPMLFGKSEVDLALARSIASTPYTAFEGTVSRYVYQSRCANVRDSSGQIVRQCVQVQVENPRYRQSQREAKQIAMNRQTREITSSIERLRVIRDGNNSLSLGERQDLDTRIARLQTESEQLLRAARSRRLF